MKAREHVVGILLAGGKSSRMGGGDKCLLPLAGRPILAHVIERLKPQVAELIISANGDSAAASSSGRLTLKKGSIVRPSIFTGGNITSLA